MGRTAAAGTDTADLKLQQHLFPLEKIVENIFRRTVLHDALEIASVY